MESRPVFYLLPLASLEPGSAATSWLGRIVQNYASPGSEYTPVDPSPFIRSPLSDKAIDDVNTILKSNSSSEVRARLSSLASIARSSKPDQNFDFSTQSIRFIRLANHADIFDALKQSPEVQQHLARSLRPGGSPAYMIVGVAIWTDAKFTKSQSVAKETCADIKAPASLAVAATTGVVLPADVDVDVGGSSTRTARTQISGLSAGSSIFAIEYRAVRRRLRSLLHDFAPSLEDYGPRTASSLFFGDTADADGASETGTTGRQSQTEQDAKKIDLDMDQDDVDWTDLLEDGPEVEEFEGFSFAFD